MTVKIELNPEGTNPLTEMQPEEDEDDFIAGLVDEDLSKRNAAQDEEVTFQNLDFDPQKKIASILDSTSRVHQVISRDPVKSLILGSFGDSLPLSFSEEVIKIPEASPKDLIGIVSAGIVGKKLSFVSGAQEIGTAKDSIYGLGKSFGERLERFFSLNLNADPASGQDQQNTPKKTQETVEPYQQPFFEGFRPDSIISAKFISDNLPGLSDRLKYIKNAEELAMLTTLSIGSSFLGRDGQNLVEAAKNPDSDLEQLLKTSLFFVAQKQGLLKGVSSKEALEKYETTIRSRKAYSQFLGQELDEISAIKIDYSEINKRIVSRLSEREIILSSPQVKTERDYIQFRESLLSLSLDLFRLPKSQPQLEEDPSYKEIKQEIQKLEERKAQVKNAKALEDLADDADTRYYWNQFEELLSRRLGATLQAEGDPKNYADYKNKLVDLVTRKVGEKLDLEIKGLVGFEAGDILQVTSMKGLDPETNTPVYYHGADNSDLPLNSEGEIAGAINQETVVVKFDLDGKIKRFNLHPEELSKTGKNTRKDPILGLGESPKEIATAIVDETEKALLPQHLRHTKEVATATVNYELENQKEELVNREERWLEENFGSRGKKVLLARALGGKDGTYRDGKTKVKNHPTGQVGKIVGRDGQYVYIEIPSAGDYLKFHREELDLLEKINQLDRAKVTVINGDRYNNSKTGSWGYLIAEHGNRLEVEFHHLTGDRDRLPARYDNVYRADVKIEPQQTGIKPELETIVREEESEYLQVQSRFNATISEGVSNLSAMGIENEIIGVFLGLHVEKKYVPQQCSGNPFAKISDLQSKLNYNKLVLDIEGKIRDEMGIFLPAEHSQDHNSETFEKFVLGLPDRVILGYDVKKSRPIKADEKIKVGEMLLSTVTQGRVGAGEIGAYESTCDSNPDGIHVLYNGRSERTCSRRSENVIPEKAFNLPDLEKFKRGYVSGAEVIIKRGSEYYGQHEGVGILQQNITRDNDEHFPVKWPDGYHNQYRRIDLDLVHPEETLKGKELEEFKKGKRAIEDLKIQVAPQVDAIVGVSRQEYERTFERIDQISGSLVDSFLSLGISTPQIKDLFSHNLRDISYFTKRKII